MKQLISLLIFACFLLTACAPTELPEDGSSISWAQAVDLLYRGDVTAVMQAHSLDVWLTLTNAATVKTVEPYIDAIFDEVQRCGARCANIMLATE